MKKYLIIIFMLSAVYLNAQQTTPFWGINYQAVALNTEGVELAGADLKNVPVSQKNISIRFSILKDSETGELVYREQHLAKTDDYGLFNVVIGQGKEDDTPVKFDKINWVSGSHFLKVEIDIKGGSEFKEFGVQRLWAVPYALSSNYADLAGNGIDSVFDNGDGSVTFKYRSGATYKTPVLKGLAGPQGAQGPAGPAGPQGIAGADGKSVLNGTNNPLATTGNLGDFYINTTNNTLFGPKTGSGWGTGTSLVGPQGTQGLTGAQGPQGIQGLTGATGPQGAQGIQGPQGIAGADGKTVLNGTNNPLATTGNLGDFYINTINNTLFGPKTGSGWGTGTSLVGPQGPQGLTGTQGPQGIQGPQGPQGLTGATGPQGAQGPQGIAGADGKSVLNGTSNPLATAGNLGDFYINTTNNTLFGPKTGSGWGTGTSLVGLQGPQGLTGAQGIQGLTGATGPQGAQGIQGPQGIAGADGKTVLNGTSNPLATAGNLGDFYINTTNNTLFGPKTVSGWGTGTSLVGPQGPQGLTGAQGPQGIQGLTGATGPQGAQGIQGPQGIAGADGKTVLNGTNNPLATTGNIGDFYINTINNTLFGPKTGSGWGIGISLVGPQGAQGLQGPQGLTGAQGPQGIQGLTGATGPQGAQGIQGPQGIAGADGESVLNGTSNPLATAGNLGDFYINTTNNTLFGPKTISGWGTGVSLVGPQGTGIISTQVVNDSLIINYSNSLTQNAGKVRATYKAGKGITISNDTINAITTIGGSLNLTGKTIIGFSSSGTWTCPSGVTQIYVQLWGGGGGSGCKYYNIAALSCDWGRIPGYGGNGGYNAGFINVTPGVIYNITIGSGGVGGTPNAPVLWFCNNGGSSVGRQAYVGGTNGQNGGSSNFNGILTAAGGNGGTSATSTSNGTNGTNGLIVNYQTAFVSSNSSFSTSSARSYIPAGYTNISLTPLSYSQGGGSNVSFYDSQCPTTSCGSGSFSGENGYCIISY